MTDNKRIRGWLCAVASAALLTGFAAITPPAGAQEQRQIQGNVSPPKTVDLTTAPELPAVPRPEGLPINRPTMPMADYLAAKNAAAAQAPQAKPNAAAPPVSSNVTLYAQVGSTNETQTTAGNQFPPGGDIATSQNWMVQVNNDVVTMYNWFTNASVQKKLNTFFADASNFIFAPRVIYDPYWNRFVVIADGCTNCGNTTTNVSTLEVAVSQSSDPSGAWYTYKVWPGTASGDFADFPQLGMDLNSLILTWNDFFGGGGSAAWATSIAKAYQYNGLNPPSISLIEIEFAGYDACTMAPPYVLDNHVTDYLLAFCPNDTKVFILSLTNTGLDAPGWAFDNAVTVSNHGIPPQAQQLPGSTYSLDTGDNRFENRSLQVGSRIINTATVGDGSSFPIPAYYNFNIGATPPTKVSEGSFFASFSSYDWHPAINANTVGASSSPLGEIFTTWMSTDPTTTNGNVQLRAGGGLGDTPPTGIVGIPVYTSAIPLTNQTDGNGVHRTGDYAYIATYPAAALGCGAGELGILEGETAGPAAGTWGTHVAIVKHC